MRLKFSLVVICIYLFYGCNPDIGNYQNSVVSLESTSKILTTPLIIKESYLPIYSTGVLGSLTEINLSFKHSGLISKILVNEGAVFKKGDLLAQIDTSEVRAIQKKAEEDLKLKIRNKKRIETLYNSQAATLEQFENSITAYNISYLNSKLAMLNFKNTSLYSSFNGKIIKKHAEEGELIGVGKPILSAINASSATKIIRCKLSDTQMLKCSLGDKAKIFFSPYSAPFSATITRIGQRANPMNGLFEIELTLDEYKRVLKDGFIGKVIISPSGLVNHYKVPISSLVGVIQDKGIFFFYKNKNIFKKEIEIIEIEKDSIIINGDSILATDSVVIDGVSYSLHTPNLDVKN